MARPRKEGLDYFAFDTDFFQKKEVVCIAGEFGPKGVMIALVLLCAIHRDKGYFALWDDTLKYSLLARKELQGVSADLMEDVVRRLAERGFFDEALLSTASVLSSHEIQERYFTAKRLPQGAQLPYCLLTPKTAQEQSKNDVCAPSGVFAEKTGVSAAKTPVFTGETPLNKNKENKTTATENACDRAASRSGRSAVADEELKIFNKIKSDEARMLRLMDELAASRREVIRWLEETEADWREAMPEHRSVREVTQHVRRTLRKKAAERDRLAAEERAARRRRPETEAALLERRRREREAEESRQSGPPVTARDMGRRLGLRPGESLADRLAREAAQGKGGEA